MFTIFSRTFCTKVAVESSCIKYINGISNRITADRLVQQKTTSKLLRARDIRDNEITPESIDKKNGILYHDACDYITDLEESCGHEWTHLGPYGVPDKTYKKLPYLSRKIGEYGTGLSIWTDDCISSRLDVDWYGLDAGAKIPDQIGIVQDNIEHHGLISNVDPMAKEEFLQKIKELGPSPGWHFIVRVDRVPKEATECNNKALLDNAKLARDRFQQWKSFKNKTDLANLVFAGKVDISSAGSFGTTVQETAADSAISVAHTLVTVDVYSPELADKMIQLNKELLGKDFQEMFEKFRENTSNLRNSASDINIISSPVERAQLTAATVIRRGGKHIRGVENHIVSKVESITNFLFKFPCDAPRCYMLQFKEKVATPYKVKGMIESVNVIPTLLNYEWLILRQAFHCFECKINYEWFFEHKNKLTDDSFRTIKRAHLLDSYFNKFCSVSSNLLYDFNEEALMEPVEIDDAPQFDLDRYVEFNDITHVVNAVYRAIGESPDLTDNEKKGIQYLFENTYKLVNGFIFIWHANDDNDVCKIKLDQLFQESEKCYLLQAGMNPTLHLFYTNLEKIAQAGHLSQDCQTLVADLQGFVKIIARHFGDKHFPRV